METITVMGETLPLTSETLLKATCAIISAAGINESCVTHCLVLQQGDRTIAAITLSDSLTDDDRSLANDHLTDNLVYDIETEPYTVLILRINTE